MAKTLAISRFPSIIARPADRGEANTYDDEIVGKTVASCGVIQAP